MVKSGRSVSDLIWDLALDVWLGIQDRICA
jgi:hypothetical protein